jgi:putative restriction endonuclease
MDAEGVVERLTALRQYQGDGRRAPHKPLLALLALGQLQATGTSELEWSMVEQRLGALLAEFGTPNSGGAASAAYPFTRLRADGIWRLSREVPNDNVGPLRSSPITGSFTSEVESVLAASPQAVADAARAVVESQFPLSVAPDVLLAAGLDPEVVFGSPSVAMVVNETKRRRGATWRMRVLEAWDRACAFCGFDGTLGGAPVGLEAAHVRWFNFGGPDELDNGLALCSLHHKLLDRGAVGFKDPQTIAVSASFTAVTDRGRQVYALHDTELRPRPGTQLPAVDYVRWHTDEVFKGAPLRTG